MSAKVGMIRCALCPKQWAEFQRMLIIAHFYEEHRANLSFCTPEELRQYYVEPIEEGT